MLKIKVLRFLSVSNRGPVRGGGGGMHVPRLNFKSCHVAISESPYVAVGISSTAAPESFETKVLKPWYFPSDPHWGGFSCKKHFNFPNYYTALS